MNPIIIDSNTYLRIANYLLAYKQRLTVDSIVFATDIPENEVRKALSLFHEKGLVEMDEESDTVRVNDMPTKQHSSKTKVHT